MLQKETPKHNDPSFSAKILDWSRLNFPFIFDILSSPIWTDSKASASDAKCVIHKTDTYYDLFIKSLEHRNLSENDLLSIHLVLAPTFVC